MAAKTYGNDYNASKGQTKPGGKMGKGGKKGC